MKLRHYNILLVFFLVILLSSTLSCKKLEDLTDNNPDLKMLEDGFKASAAIGYCASLAHLVLTGEEVPNNVTFSSNQSDYSRSGLIYVHVSSEYPLPFNNNIGDIIIAAIWDDLSQSGVMAVVFGDFDILNADYQFYGIQTVPFVVEENTGNITTVFARQDIVIGEGSDTILNLSLTNPQFNLETERARETPPENAFAAISQNVWFVTVNQNNRSLLYDDDFYISGGGQMAEARANEGGITYHALIDTRFNYSQCDKNPVHGTGFIQKLKAGTGIDLGNITIDFHKQCNGQGYVTAALGDYLKYWKRDVNLNFDN